MRKLRKSKRKLKMKKKIVMIEGGKRGGKTLYAELYIKALFRQETPLQKKDYRALLKHYQSQRVELLGFWID